MPTYCFVNTKTGEYHEKIMSFTKRGEYLNENTDLEVVIGGAPTVGDPVRLGLKKPDSGFREVLQKIKSSHHGSTVNTW